MAHRFFLIALRCMLLWSALAHPSFSKDAGDGPDSPVWTAIIPDAFPGYVYTWRMSTDGTYREDGRDAVKGTAIQPTLSGRWRVEGPRMILRQQDEPFMFDGMVLGSLYNGTLYHNGRAVSRFCAARGEKPPQICSAQPGVAMLGALTSRRLATCLAQSSALPFAFGETHRRFAIASRSCAPFVVDGTSAYRLRIKASFRFD